MDYFLLQDGYIKENLQSQTIDAIFSIHCNRMVEINNIHWMSGFFFKMSSGNVN